MAIRNLPEMPCGPILELHGQRKRFHVPYGLKPLLEDLTREVLRHQPENLYEFLATFMEARVQKKREELESRTRRKSWEQHRWSWEGGSVLTPGELKEFLDTLPAPQEVANHHATVIQAAFRGYQARKKVKEIRKSLDLEDAATIARKSVEEAKRRRSSQPGGENQEGTTEKKTDADGANQEGSEEKPKRKSWEQHRWSWEGTSVLPPGELKEFVETLPATEEVVNHHATVIQAAFRGYQARKKVKEIRKSLDLEDAATIARRSVEEAKKRRSGEGNQEATPEKKTDPDAANPEAAPETKADPDAGNQEAVTETKADTGVEVQEVATEKIADPGAENQESTTEKKPDPETENQGA